jgi:hypothetical protein
MGFSPCLLDWNYYVTKEGVAVSVTQGVTEDLSIAAITVHH